MVNIVNNNLKSIFVFLILVFIVILYPLALNGSAAQYSQIFEIKLNPGWNLVSFPFTDAKINFKESDCYFLYLYAQYFNTTAKKFEKINIKTANNIGAMGLYLYSFDNCTLKVSGNSIYNPSQIDLKKGINLIAVPYGGINLRSLSGCKINFVRYYNSSDRKWHQWESQWGGMIEERVYNASVKRWEKVNEFTSFLLPGGLSIIIHVNEDCRLSFETGTPLTTTTTTTTSTTIPRRTTTTTTRPPRPIIPIIPI